MFSLKKFACLSLGLIIVFSLIYAFYTIPKQIEMGGEWYPNPNATNPNVPATMNEIINSLYASITFYLIIAIIAGYLAIKTYRTASFLSGPRRETLMYLATYFSIVSIAAILLTLGIIKFTLDGYSETKITLFIIEIYFYPLTIPISSALIAISILYVPIFGYLMSEKKYPSKLVESILLVLVFIELIVLALPENWYGCYVPYSNNQPLYPDYRPLSVLILLIIFLYGTLVTAFKVYKRIKVSEDPIVKVRLKIMGTAFIMLDLFFIFYMIDSAIGGGFTIFMVIAAISAVIAFTGIYLSIVPPEWLMARLQRKYGK